MRRIRSYHPHADSISLSVTGVGDYGVIEWGEVAHYGAVVTVRVLT